MGCCPIVSAVTPLRNQARFLPDFLRALQAQTLEDWELVLVDGQSDDNPEAIVREFGDERVRFVACVDDRGIGYGRNEAIIRSRGQFIAYCDADDMPTPTSFESRVDELRSSGSLWLHAIASVMHGSEWRADASLAPRRQEALASGDAYAYAKCVHSATVMFRRSFFDKLGGFDEGLRYEEDREMWWRAVGLGHMPAWLAEVVCHYRLHDGQATKTQKPNMHAAERAMTWNHDVRMRDGITAENTRILWS